MSARKLETPGAFAAPAQITHKRLTLPSDAVRFRRNGIEFRSTAPINPWTEMTVSLHSPRDSRKINCTGIVVACTGSRQTSFTISMVFTNMSRQSEAFLTSLAYS